MAIHNIAERYTSAYSILTGGKVLFYPKNIKSLSLTRVIPREIL